jgi:hypothetical protein
MAQIDVTELFTDPDFVDPMQVITRYPLVDDYGENYIKETVLDTVGCIQPADGRTMNKLPDSMKVANVSSFWFKGQIVATAACKYSSVLVFRGVRYQVQNVFDWTNWGAGWTEGTCVAEVPA